jgi:hypothetical protein
VKSYSEDSSFDPAAADGPSDLLRGQMARVIQSAEELTGQSIQTVRADDLAEWVEIDYRLAWSSLEQGTVALPSAIREGRGADYQEGDVLVDSSWHQQPPYNNDCPDMGCTFSSLNPNAHVGCVATAGAQIMYYWSWPPNGVGSPYDDPYDWPSMVANCYYSFMSSCYIDESDTADYHCLTQPQLDAMSELCFEVAEAVNMDYGCAGSSAYTDQMVGVFENVYRYDTACGVEHRSDNTASEWFTMVKAQCNMNRPMEYRILGHAIVCDGWQEPGIPQYHMNYGWDNAYNAWYTIDALHQPDGGSPDDEYVVRSILPMNSIVGAFSGAYAKPTYPYRYFTKDSQGHSATFAPGHNLQFLPGVTIDCGSGYVAVEGSSSNASRLFTRGDRSRGMKITGGAMKLLPNGEVTIP